MQKVITINLNGNAFQLDESGYDALREYLASAERELAANPDRSEIVADLEQAIGDKCRRFLGPHKSVVTAAEVQQIVAEMGPIEAAPGEEHTATDTSGASASAGSAATAAAKRLYRIPAGAMIAGVCNGLATFLAIDVTFVRIGFVIAAALTKGAAIFVYVVLMFVIPEASTGEERAAAGGEPFNAKEVIERAKKQYAAGQRQFRRQWRQQQRQWQRHRWGPPAPGAYAGAPWVGAMLPFFGLIHLALFLTMAALVISLVNTGSVLQWTLPDDVPVWAGVLILFVGYQIVVSPIRAAHRWPWPAAPETAGVVAFWNAVMWLVGIAVVIWIASGHVPEIREFIHRVPDVFRDLVADIKSQPR